MQKGVQDSQRFCRQVIRQLLFSSFFCIEVLALSNKSGFVQLQVEQDCGQGHDNNLRRHIDKRHPISNAALARKSRRELYLKNGDMTRSTWIHSNNKVFSIDFTASVATTGLVQQNFKRNNLVTTNTAHARYSWRQCEPPAHIPINQ